MSRLRYFKLTQVPSLVFPDSVYFVKNGEKVDQYISSDEGKLLPVVSSTDGGGDLFTAANKDIDLIAGTPVTQHPSGTGIIQANASDSNKYCIGLLAEDITTNTSGKIQLGGVLTLTDWAGIIGVSTLSPKTKYFLGTAGRLTAAPVLTPGNICQLVGISVDEKTLSIICNDPIYL